MPSMKITEAHTVQCCGYSHTFDNAYDPLNWLLMHIEAEHKTLFAKLESEGRRLARSQNGCGYYDTGAKTNDGWHKAQSTFREAWRRKALKARLGQPCY